MAVSAREGITHAWLLDVAVHPGPDEVPAEPFEAASLALARLWVD